MIPRALLIREIPVQVKDRVKLCVLCEAKRIHCLLSHMQVFWGSVAQHRPTHVVKVYYQCVHVHIFGWLKFSVY